MAYVLKNIKELVLNLLGMTVTSWLCRKMSLFFKAVL